MTTSSESGKVPAPLRLLRDLLDGNCHDRHSAKKLLKVSLAAVDRHIKLLRRALPAYVKTRKERTRTVVYAELDAPSLSAIVAALFGSSLAPLLRGTTYEKELAAARRSVFKRARESHQFADVDRKFYFVHGGGDSALLDRAGDLDDLIDAVLKNKKVRFDYTHANGACERRLEVSPLTIVIYRHQFYLIARSEAHRVYPYRFSRMRNVEDTGFKFDYPKRADYDPDQVFRDSLGVHVSDSFETASVAVRLTGAWAGLARTHRWHPSQRNEDVAESVIVRLHVKLCPEVDAWVLGFGVDAEVLEPPQLRDRIALQIQAMAQRYQPVVRTQQLPAKAKPRVRAPTRLRSS